MGRTVESEILRRKGFGKGGDKERCGEVEAERSGDAGGEELGPEVGENVGEAGRVVEEGMDDLGRGKRKRKGSTVKPLPISQQPHSFFPEDCKMQGKRNVS